MPPAENVAVQMRHGFPRILSIINHQPVTALRQAKLFGDLRRLQQQMSEHLLVRARRLGNTRDRLLRNDQHVRRRRRFDILQGEHLIIFINDRRGNFARGNFLKKRFAHLTTAPPGSMTFRQIPPTDKCADNRQSDR